jgi:ribosomal protein L39E
VGGRTAKRLGLVRRGAGPVPIGSMHEQLEGGVPSEIRLALRTRAAKAIRQATRVPITVRLRGDDPLGNATEVIRRVTLRR